MSPEQVRQLATTASRHPVPRDAIDAARAAAPERYGALALALAEHRTLVFPALKDAPQERSPLWPVSLAALTVGVAAVLLGASPILAGVLAVAVLVLLVSTRSRGGTAQPLPGDVAWGAVVDTAIAVTAADLTAEGTAWDAAAYTTATRAWQSAVLPLPLPLPTLYL